MNKYLRSNQQLWNTWTPYHLTSEFYDVEGFKAGRSRRRSGLDELEIELVGDVTGKSLLHLQCHFGLDTISWARRGAVATGVDFADAAITAARDLAAEMGVSARFVHSNVYDLPAKLDGQFDIVFTSHGVLGWLPDLDAWGRVIAHFLKPGATFYIIEAHPVALMFDDHRADEELHLFYPYFHGAEPWRDEHSGSYAAPEAPIHSVEFYFAHTLSEIIGALVRAGLRISGFAEYPFVGWPILPWMEQRPDGSWEMPGRQDLLPLMYSLSATK